MAPIVVKEEYEKVKISKEEADRIMKKAYNKKRDMLISVGIIIVLIIIFFIVIFSSLRNHAANSLYERVYEYETVLYEVYEPEGGSDVFTLNGTEYEFDQMRNKFKFYEDNTMDWTMSFDTDLTDGENFTEEVKVKHSFEIRSDVFVGEPYIMLDNGIKLEVLCENTLGQPIASIDYYGE